MSDYTISFGRYKGCSAKLFFDVVKKSREYVLVKGLYHYREEIVSYCNWCQRNRRKFSTGHQLHKLVNDYVEAVVVVELDRRSKARAWATRKSEELERQSRARQQVEESDSDGFLSCEEVEGLSLSLGNLNISVTVRKS